MTDDAHNARGRRGLIVALIVLDLLVVIGATAFVVVERLPQQRTLSASQQATQTALAPATATAGVIAKASTGTVIYSDPLTDGTTQNIKSAKWDGNTYGDYGCAIQRSGYIVTTSQALTQLVCSEWSKVFEDFATQVDMTIKEGYAGGFFCRVGSDSEGYLFELDDQGSYRISLSNVAKMGGTTLRDWTRSSAIKTGYAVTNRLQVIAQGDMLFFYVNGTYLWGTTDSHSAEGTLAFYATAGPDGKNSTVIFRDLNVYALSL